MDRGVQHGAARREYHSRYCFTDPLHGACSIVHRRPTPMQRHIDEIALHVAREAHAVLLLDRAGWHTTGNLVWPKNITPILLPSRSPEL